MSISLKLQGQNRAAAAVSCICLLFFPVSRPHDLLPLSNYPDNQLQLMSTWTSYTVVNST